jgi:DnaJ domain
MAGRPRPVTPPPEDPYATLGVSPGVSDQELRSAYRRLVRLHHPDHNGGSVESARRFEAVQEAYTRIRELRQHAPPPPPPRAARDSGIDERLRDIERELRDAQEAREHPAVKRVEDLIDELDPRHRARE